MTSPTEVARSVTSDAADRAAAGSQLWRRRTRLAQALVLVIMVGGLVYVADTVVGGTLFSDPTTVTVELPQAAGLHDGSVVTYRGQRIGEVTDVRLADEPQVRAVAVLQIDADVDVPRDSVFEVSDLSAVGEQYLDVRPRTDRGPFLADGDTIPVDDTTVPLSVPEVLADAQSLMRHLDVDDVQTIARETATIFGSGDGHVDLRSLAIELESGFAMLRRLEPKLTHLVVRGATPLTTAQDLGPQVRRISRDLDAVTAALATATPDVRRTVVAATDLLPRLSRWWHRSSPAVRRLLAGGGPLTDMAARHLRGLQHWLDWVPLQADVMAGSTRDGSGRVLLVPRILKNCVYSPDHRRDIQDLSHRTPYTDVHCVNPPPGTQVRGSASVPHQ
ncbi:MlaD family protein [Nocardioides panacisoli]|uniref:MlaD family protein n=1 Tax=Nocardioides panacisoli TaxID=627624 RepID=A0ABP7HYX5_9ACTN